MSVLEWVLRIILVLLALDVVIVAWLWRAGTLRAERRSRRDHQDRGGSC